MIPSNRSASDKRIEPLTELDLHEFLSKVIKIYEGRLERADVEDTFQNTMLRWLNGELKFEDKSGLEKFVFTKCKFQVIDIARRRANHIKIEWYDPYYEVLLNQRLVV